MPCGWNTTRDGARRVEDKQLRLRAGQTVALAVGQSNQPVSPAATVKTELKVHVPADAKVYLAGAATSQTGEQRVYASSQLRPGQTWTGYTVRVEWHHDGRKEVQQRTLDIVGGENYELEFDFAAASDQLAMAD